MKLKRNYNSLMALVLAGLCLILSVLSGCAEKKAEIPFVDPNTIDRDQFPVPSGGFFLNVNGDIVNSNEIIDPLIEPLKPYAEKNSFEDFAELIKKRIELEIANKISGLILYQQAKIDAGENIQGAVEKAADGEIKKLIADMGGDYAKAEQQIKEMGLDWTSFKDYQKRMILSQWYMFSKLPEQQPITHSDLLELYNKIKDEVYTKEPAIEFQLIDIDEKKIELTDPNESREKLAFELAENLLEQIRNGADFGQLAKENSHDYRSQYEGKWPVVNPQSLAKPYNVLALEAEKIEPGTITEPIRAEGHIFIMKLLAKSNGKMEPFENVQKELEARLTIQNRKTAVDELSLKLMQQASIANQQQFSDYCIRQIYQRSIQ